MLTPNVRLGQESSLRDIESYVRFCYPGHTFCFQNKSEEVVSERHELLPRSKSALWPQCVLRPFSTRNGGMNVIALTFTDGPEQDAVRDKEKGRGLMWPDTFSEERILLLPPGA